MTAKLKTPSSSSLSKFEKEIEKLRSENKWSRLFEFVGSSKDQKNNGNLIVFCRAEAELENYLFSNPMAFQNLSAESTSIVASGSQPSQKSNDALARIEKALNETANKRLVPLPTFDSLESIAVEANILLAKLYYSQMRFDEASIVFSRENIQQAMYDQIKALKQQQSHDLNIKVSNLRQLQLFAEAHSIKGLCLEKKRVNNLAANNGNYMDEEQHIIDSFEVSSHIAIRHSLEYMRSQSSAKDQTSAGGVGGGMSSATSNLESIAATTQSLNAANNIEDNLDLINPLYEIALQKAPLLYIKRG